jgi:nucleoid-associated protein YgaU
MPAAQAGVRRHAVVDGDTLSQLAARYLGRADAYLEIYELNRDVLASPDLLPIGAVLKIPERGADPGRFAGEGPRDLVPVPGRP